MSRIVPYLQRKHYIRMQMEAQSRSIMTGGNAEHAARSLQHRHAGQNHQQLSHGQLVRCIFLKPRQTILNAHTEVVRVIG
jgi:hypothetical protein